jgi:uncharacterized FlgJ-related protein
MNPSFLEAAILHRRASASTSFVLGSAASGSPWGRSKLTPPALRSRLAAYRGTTDKNRSAALTEPRHNRISTKPGALQPVVLDRIRELQTAA